MGIPHLANFLEPYGKNVSLGCRHEPHHRDRDPISPEASSYKIPTAPRERVIIDGPAMVHFVYSRLLTLSHQELPSYRRLSRAVEGFLIGLQDYGLDIAAVYFDGALPESKRPTRLARLESSASRLSKLKATYPQGFLSTIRTDPSELDSTIGFDTLLASSKPIPAGLSSWPIPPFIIPTCLDHLEKSMFASQVEIVPGEADVFCATHAFQHGGIVLSGDSDLLIHALGPHGAYVPLSTLELGTCSGCSESSVPLLRGRAYRRIEIEQSLGIQNLVRVAFEISENPHATLAMAVQRARQGMLDSEAKRLATFSSLYEDLPLRSDEDESSARAMLKSLDPRVAEFIWQLENTTMRPAEVHVYLPLLFEDQTRVSAWAICSDVRDLAYNAAVGSCHQNTEGIVVIEMMRSGPKRIAGRSIDIRRLDQLNSSARKWCDCGDTVIKKLTGSSSLDFWRILALTEVCTWYIRSGRCPPSAEHLRLLLTNKARIGPGMGSWYDIHLAAQFQAAVYSFRVLHQILQRCEHLPDSLKRLKERVHGLPPLAPMLEGHLESVTVGAAIDLVLRADQEEAHQRASSSTPPPEATMATPQALEPGEPKENSRRDESSRARIPHHTQSEEEEVCSENMYNVLANRDA